MFSESEKTKTYDCVSSLLGNSFQAVEYRKEEKKEGNKAARQPYWTKMMETYIESLEQLEFLSRVLERKSCKEENKTDKEKGRERKRHY